jgi:hypothetical protein
LGAANAKESIAAREIKSEPKASARALVEAAKLRHCCAAIIKKPIPSCGGKANAAPFKETVAGSLSWQAYTCLLCKCEVRNSKDKRAGQRDKIRAAHRSDTSVNPYWRIIEHFWNEDIPERRLGYIACR